MAAGGWVWSEGVIGPAESTHSIPRAEARGMRRVNTERRFLLRFKNRDLAPSNVSIPYSSSGEKEKTSLDLSKPFSFRLAVC